jgi:hypothetical protein
MKSNNPLTGSMKETFMTTFGDGHAIQSDG